MTSADSRQLPPRRALHGTLRVPGDKSISHRALLFSALATGRSRIEGLSPGGDVRSTRGVLESLGIEIHGDAGFLAIDGRGWSGLDWHGSAALDCDCGNSGTTARLLMGLFAGRRGSYRLHGDESLSRRPMRRVADRLVEMGARIEGARTLPLTVHGAALRGGAWRTEVASAQVKSALILAALQAEGESTIEEPQGSRDHTERMLAAMGAPIGVESGRRCRVAGGAPRLEPLDLEVPGDPSSSAFAVALACLVPGSELRVEQVSLNPRRTGFYRLLQRMGAELRFERDERAERRSAGEPCGTIVARSGALVGIEVQPEEVVDAIDELPLLAVVLAAAQGASSVRGAEELRHKESDRISATVQLLRSFGAQVEELPDGLAIAGGTAFQSGVVEAQHDHRIAMSAAVAASLAPVASTLHGARWVEISYPSFFDDLDRLSR